MSDERAPHSDAFEANEMHDGARVVRRDKKVSRLMVGLLAIPGLLIILLGVFIASANATAQKPVPAAALPFVSAAVVGLGVLLCALGIAFGVLRTVVTERAVHVRYGLWGPTIPIANIRSCKVVDYDWTKFGGWGIRRGRDGTWAYVPASSGKVLEIVYRDLENERRVIVGVDDAVETARHIKRTRAANTTKPMRVADVSAAAADVAEEDEIEDAAPSERRRKGS